MQEYTAAMPPRPVYEEPSVIEKVRKVKQYIPGMLRTKNLFGWRYFVEDLKVDIECEIYKYEEKHLAGVPGYEKEQGVGAYCNMAIQGAINYAAACNAQKRRLKQLSRAELMELRKVRTGPKGDRMRSILTEV